MEFGKIFTRGLAIVALGAFTTTGLVGISSSASAQSQIPPIELTGDIVESFIKSYPTVKVQAEALGKNYNVQPGGTSAADNWGAWLTVTAAYGELNGLVTPYGFADFQSWLNATISIATAYAFAKEGDTMNSGMAEAIEQIESNPGLSDDQKKMMLDQMQAAAGAISGMKPPQENIDAVTPYIDQLATLFE